jgi:hypothetical protein
LSHKKNKKKRLHRTQHCRQPAAKSPRTKSPTAAGMRQCKRSLQPKKGIRIKSKNCAETEGKMEKIS